MTHAEVEKYLIFTHSVHKITNEDFSRNFENFLKLSKVLVFVVGGHKLEIQDKT